ncbi:hypothetical protein TNCV_3583881 [Trichonephila clavipes]|nr:hypothetical protein TNCV_3583881 [Trichonephila clavipes]
MYVTKCVGYHSKEPENPVGNRVTRGQPSLSCNDKYSHKLASIRRSSASLYGYPSRYNLSVNRAFPSANP